METFYLSYLDKLNAVMSSPIFKDYKDRYRTNSITGKVYDNGAEMITACPAFNTFIQIVFSESVFSQFAKQTGDSKYKKILIFMLFSSSTNVLEAFLEWVPADVTDTQPNCALSKGTKQNCHLRNTTNNNIICVGNACVEQFPFSEETKSFFKTTK